MTTPLAMAFIRGDYRSFNADPRRGKAFMSRLTLEDTVLRHFDLKTVGFGFCRFVGVTFFDLDSVEFTECTFERCSFERHGKDPVQIKGTKFTKCEFIGVRFHAAHVVGSDFRKCSFSRTRLLHEGTQIEECVFNDCKGLERLHDLNMVTLPESVSYRPYSLKWPEILNSPGYWLDIVANWRSLAFFSRLPILNVSYVFLVALTAYVIVISSLLNLIGALILRLPEEIRPVLRPDELMAWIRGIAIPRSEALWVVGAFVLLAIASTLYKLGAPSQVQEYSLDKWTLELRRHRLNYAAFIRHRRWACVIAMLLTIFAFAIMIVVTVLKFGIVIKAFTA